MRHGRAGHSAVRLPDGRVLISGGVGVTGVLRDAELFEPETALFTNGPSLAKARTRHAAALLPDGTVLVTGGFGQEAPLRSTEIFDPLANRFVAGPGMNRARAGHSITTLRDGRLLLIGGDRYGTAEIFDPVTGSFGLLPSRLSSPRTLHSAVPLSDGRILIAGGLGLNLRPLRSAELFNPETLDFRALDSRMRAPRVQPDLRVLPDGKVQIIGGDDARTIEMFNPHGEYFTALIAPGTARILRAPHPQREEPFQQDMKERVDYSLTEVPQLGYGLIAGGVTKDGRLSTTAYLVGISPATVTTDKTDYVPGETVIITGEGWVAGEMVTLTLHRDNGSEDTVLFASVGHEGKFVNDEYVVQPGDLDVVFLLTATGETSGYTAQTTFTDQSSEVTQIGFNTVNQPASFTVGIPNPASTPLRVQSQDSGGAGESVTGAGQAITVEVTSDSPTGRFDTTTGGSFESTSLTLLIPSGSQNSQNFFYRDTSAGLVTLNATVTAKTSALANLALGATAAVTKTVNRANSTTSLASSLSTTSFGQEATFTATVAHATGGAGSPTGTVTFKNGSEVLATVGLNTSFEAALPLSSLTVGAHSITATYSGDTNFNGSASAARAHTVVKADTTTEISSDPSPSVFGQSVTFTAKVTGSVVAEGTVLIRKGLDVLAGPTPLDANGEASFTPTLAAGTHDVVADYSGTGNYNPSSSPPLTQIVDMAPTSVEVAADINPAIFGQPVAFTATVTGNIAVQGSVVFQVDDDLISGPIPLDHNGRAQVIATSLALGPHTVTAQFIGGSDFHPSSGSLGLVINPIPTTTSVVTTPSAVDYSDMVTFAAQVAAASGAGGSLNGSVTFHYAGFSAGPVAVDASGYAALSVKIDDTSLVAGCYELTVVFASSNPHYAGSTGTTLVEVATEGPVTLSYTGDTLVMGGGSTATVNLRATIEQPADGSLADFALLNSDGDRVVVDFYLNGDWVGTVPVANSPGADGAAFASLATTVAVGTYTVEARLRQTASYFDFLLVNNQQIVASHGESTLVVANSSSASATGGGWLPDAASSNGKGTFGFTANFNKRLSEITGGLVYIYRSSDPAAVSPLNPEGLVDVRIVARELTGMGLIGGTANSVRISARASLEIVDSVSGSIIGGFAPGDGANLSITATDSPDQLGLVLRREDGTVFKLVGELNGDGSARPVRLGGGQVIVRGR